MGGHELVVELVEDLDLHALEHDAGAGLEDLPDERVEGAVVRERARDLDDPGVGLAGRRRGDVEDRGGQAGVAADDVPQIDPHFVTVVVAPAAADRLDGARAGAQELGVAVDRGRDEVRARRVPDAPREVLLRGEVAQRVLEELERLAERVAHLTRHDRRVRARLLARLAVQEAGGAVHHGHLDGVADVQVHVLERLLREGLPEVLGQVLVALGQGLDLEPVLRLREGHGEGGLFRVLDAEAGEDRIDERDQGAVLC